MKFGLSNDTGIVSKNISIIEGTFRLRVPEGTEGAKIRINKNNEKVNELSFTTLSGYISKLDFVDTESFGRKLELYVSADKEYKLSLGFADGLASNIYKMLPNIDPSEPVSISLTRKPDESGKERTSLFINQSNAPVKWAYTRATPNGMPGMEKVKVKGVDIWDNTKQIDFLMENAVRPFQEKLQNVIRRKEDVDELLYDTGEVDPTEVPPMDIDLPDTIHIKVGDRIVTEDEMPF